MLATLPQWVTRYLESGGPVLGIATLVVLWVLYKLSRRALHSFLQAREYKEESIQQFLFIWRYVWVATGAVFGIVSFSGSLATLGISAAFLGMVLGWSLQAPVTGVAAWLMIILKQPFKIGDRVIIAGIIGDVVDITLTHVLLNQVGGTIGGEEKSGRAVLIPNATLFQQIIYNYTLEGTAGSEDAAASSYILDEVPVRITFRSDFDEAERILIAAAKEVTSDIIRDTQQEPFVRAELFDSGILARLRYLTLGKDRQRISSEIVRVIIRQFHGSGTVEFAYPQLDLHYAARDGRTAAVDQPKPEPTAG